MESLTEDDIIGALRASCSNVGDRDHFCTYEILLVTDGGFGTVIATGSLEFNRNEGGFLIVEATGDDFSTNDGGILSITYKQMGGINYVITGELSLS